SSRAGSSSSKKRAGSSSARGPSIRLRTSTATATTLGPRADPQRRRLGGRHDRVRRWDGSAGLARCAQPRLAGGGKRRRLGECRGTLEIERVEKVARIRVAVRERAEIPFGLDQLQDRRVVVHLVRDVVAFREG